MIVSGLNYDNDFRSLKGKPLNVSTLDNKSVFEVYLYSFTRDSESKFTQQPLNNIFTNIVNGFVDPVEFVMEASNPFHLFVSEYGYDRTHFGQVNPIQLDLQNELLAYTLFWCNFNSLNGHASFEVFG